MNDIFYKLASVSIFIVLSLVYYNTYLVSESVDKIFLTLSTFLFALLTGFFISRQSGRYGELRKLTANFDGNISSIYRIFGHFSPETQNNAGEIIKNHYKKIVSGGWDYPLTHKTTTLTDLHKEIDVAVDRDGTDGVRGASISRIMFALGDLQKIRKSMVALRNERIPTFQWMLVYLLTAILCFVVSTIDSYHLVLGSLVKAAFVVAVFSVVMLLNKLDSLQLFGGSIGEDSANDVIEIIDKKK